MKTTKSSLLVTGGAGFIGSHTSLTLLELGHSIVVLDNFQNSSHKSLTRVSSLLGPQGASNLTLVKGDIRSREDLNRAFKSAPRGKSISAVIHFAGVKAVEESAALPLEYWDINTGGTINLLSAMKAHHCRNIVFSSSATLYGSPKVVPISESEEINPINPYGRTKLAAEKALEDLGNSNASWRIAILRYFNPVGAHPSGYIGEDPRGTPSNLFPYIVKVGAGKLDKLKVFGSDWPTIDGTGVRDYIHVMDLARAHCAALSTLMDNPPQTLTLNIGCGLGHSVLQVVEAFKATAGVDIPYQLVGRRPGDAAISVADPTEANRRLGWRPKHTIEDMCRDAWNWQINNPEGY